MNFVDFVSLSQLHLQSKLVELFKGQCINKPGEYLLVKGVAPVMLIAHMDTVHKAPVTDVCMSTDGNIVISPQGIGGDDRCGVYGLMRVYQRSEVKPWLLFTCDEEIGGVGASHFVRDYEESRLSAELDAVKMLIELDRRGSDDAVFYDCDNDEFASYILGKGFKTAFGSFSDISYIAPAMGVAAVNLSSGYYSAHTTHEYVRLNELERTIEKVIEIVKDSLSEDLSVFPYIERYGDQYDHYDPNDYSGWIESFITEKYHHSLEELTTPATHTQPLRMKDRILDSERKPIPETISHEYRGLLDEYTKEELDSIRRMEGDEIIWNMWLLREDRRYAEREKNYV